MRRLKENIIKERNQEEETCEIIEKQIIELNENQLISNNKRLYTCL
jgi:hypothetical protein